MFLLNFIHIRRTEAIDIFHCTTGQKNPLTWYDGNAMAAQNGRDSPTKFALLNPNNTIFTNRIIFLFFDFLLHYMPALIYDRYLETQGRKAKWFRLVKKRAEILRTGEILKNQHSLEKSSKSIIFIQWNSLRIVLGYLTQKTHQNYIMRCKKLLMVKNFHSMQARSIGTLTASNIGKVPKNMWWKILMTSISP